MVSAARASLKQKPGCYTLWKFPIDYLYGEKDELILSYYDIGIIVFIGVKIKL